MSYLAYYPTGASVKEVWERVSPTQLRKKKYARWTRVYKGIFTAGEAEGVMNEALALTNIEEAYATHVDGGVWEVTATILEEEWTNEYKAG